MNKTQLIEAIAEKTNLSKADVGTVLEVFQQTVIETVSAKEKVSLTGFGTFAATERSARKGRNPQTGEELQLAATTIPSFKAGKLFKDAVKS
jgi:DNA-binding protein HU-beta